MPEKYKVIEALDYYDNLAAAKKLAEKVNEHMNDGWIPVGGIAIGFHSDGRQPYWYAMQSMVRDPLYKKRPFKDPQELANDPNFSGEGIA